MYDLQAMFSRSQDPTIEVSLSAFAPARLLDTASKATPELEEFRQLAKRF